MTQALVIDDNRSTADSLVRVLKALGVQARPAYGPGPAMALLRVETPDVIFLDINMPGVTGFDILGFVGREPRLVNVPVIICTSDDQPQTRTDAMKAGARDFLLKPVTVDALEQALKKLKLI
ncbi:MAG: response regulator [Anaerolineales bacterium]|nr:response regulator [Anaerolineales bacterium]MCX7756188.1 response regulator [Anaerolineales bacterium]MDW8276910.1 response regulator [Anaerolineales bacterium]